MSQHDLPEAGPAGIEPAPTVPQDWAAGRTETAATTNATEAAAPAAAEPTTEATTEAAAAATETTEAAPAPPRPGPPAFPRPSPALLAALAPAASPAARFGRVDPSGTVYVRTVDGEKEVGTYPGVSPAHALGYFARKYDELAASADLLLQRVTHTELAAKESAELLARLREQVAEAHVVGDLEALAAKVAEIAAGVETRRLAEGAQRAAARRAARAQREALVAEAEHIAAQPEAKVQWKSSGARMRELLEQWKEQQRSGARLDRESEASLWQRFSTARNSFDKARRVHFAHLESAQAEARAVKQRLVEEAQTLAASQDWAPTATAFKRLMDRWRAAGRAARVDDDALWEQFKAAQDGFFAAKDAISAKEDQELAANLAVKTALLAEAERLLPLKGTPQQVEATRSRLRGIQERWDKAGKVPRADMERLEQGIRRVEQAVREVHEKRWNSRNPEGAARAQSFVEQLRSAVDALTRDLAQARESGNARAVADAEAALSSRQQWLRQAETALDEFGG